MWTWPGTPDADPPVPVPIVIWRSVRARGDTKAHRSRRTLAMAQRCVDALIPLRDQHTCRHGTDCGSSHAGTQLDRHNVLCSFRTVAVAAELTAKDCAPRELRHSFVSLRERHAAGGHRAACRSPDHHRDQNRVPQAAPADEHPGGM